MITIELETWEVWLLCLLPLICSLFVIAIHLWLEH